LVVKTKALVRSSGLSGPVFPFITKATGYLALSLPTALQKQTRSRMVVGHLMSTTFTILPRKGFIWAMETSAANGNWAIR
jgi:hypothetical protein